MSHRTAGEVLDLLATRDPHDHEIGRRSACERRAQGAVGLVERPWTSRGFLRAHCQSKHVDTSVLDDDEAWAHDLICESWPDEAREQLDVLVSSFPDDEAIARRRADLP